MNLDGTAHRRRRGHDRLEAPAGAPDPAGAALEHRKATAVLVLHRAAVPVPGTVLAADPKEPPRRCTVIGVITQAGGGAILRPTVDRHQPACGAQPAPASLHGPDRATSRQRPRTTLRAFSRDHPTETPAELLNPKPPQRRPHRMPPAADGKPTGDTSSRRYRPCRYEWAPLHHPVQAFCRVTLRAVRTAEKIPTRTAAGTAARLMTWCAPARTVSPTRGAVDHSERAQEGQGGWIDGLRTVAAMVPLGCPTLGSVQVPRASARRGLPLPLGFELSPDGRAQLLEVPNASGVPLAGRLRSYGQLGPQIGNGGLRPLGAADGAAELALQLANAAQAPGAESGFDPLGAPSSVGRLALGGGGIDPGSAQEPTLRFDPYRNPYQCPPTPAAPGPGPCRQVGLGTRATVTARCLSAAIPRNAGCLDLREPSPTGPSGAVPSLLYPALWTSGPIHPAGLDHAVAR
jgi:hypothetical protein